MPDGPVLENWKADRGVYIRSSLLLAGSAMVAATLVLYILGNESYWVGAIAALLATGIRNGYLASEELAMEWELRDDSLSGSNGRSVQLSDIAKVRKLGSAVQIITQSGDKMLMKYLADPDEVRSRIARAAGIAQ